MPAAADEARLDDLFAQLARAETKEAASRIEREIQSEWSRSGSPAIDLLLQRGRDAIEAGDSIAAVEHLTAAIDHAPDFAEAYHLRATAYYRLGQIGPALDDLRETLLRNPRHYPAMRGLAVILQEIGRRDEALEVFRRVLALHPQDEAVAEAAARLERERDGRLL
jgi:Tfp pilus assembly protein PilF